MIPNAHASPAASITTAASTGPTARPMLNVTELSASAAERWLWSTSDGTKAIIAGVVKAFAIPSRNAKTIRATGVTSPSAVSSVSRP